MSRVPPPQLPAAAQQVTAALTAKVRAHFPALLCAASIEVRRVQRSSGAAGLRLERLAAVMALAMQEHAKRQPPRRRQRVVLRSPSPDRVVMLEISTEGSSVAGARAIDDTLC